MVRDAGFDFVEISVDETDERLARLDWTTGSGRTSALFGILVSMCYHVFKRSSSFPLGSEDPKTRARADCQRLNWRQYRHPYRATGGL